MDEIIEGYTEARAEQDQDDEVAEKERVASHSGGFFLDTVGKLVRRTRVAVLLRIA